MTLIKEILLGAVIFYFLVLGYLYFFQRNMMYFPGDMHPPIEALNIDGPIIYIRQDETGHEFMRSWYWPAKKPGYETIVFFHGNGQAYQFWMNKLNTFKSLGYGAIYVEYPGYGGLDGKPSEQGIYNNAELALNWLKEKQNIPPEQMIFYGESLGTGVAVEMAKRNPTIKAMVLESSYSSTVDIAASQYPMFPVRLLMKDRYESIEKIETLVMPKLFIHAENDGIIPIKFARKLYEAAPEPKKFIVIEHGGHNDLYDNGAPLHVTKFLSTITNENKKTPDAAQTQKD